MLSFERGRPISIIKGGRFNDRVIHIYDPTMKCCERCGPKCIKRNSKKCCRDCSGGCIDKGIEANCKPDIKNNPMDIIDDNFLRTLKGKIKKDEYIKIYRALRTGDDDDDISNVLESSRKETDERSKKEFSIHDEGVVQPLPNFNKTERIYVAGPTDSGKTYYVKKYLQQMRKVYPKKNIYVISDVENDDEIDVINNIIRVSLDDDFLKSGPLNPEVFKDSVVVFDDIDSIQNKQIYAAVTSLRDSLLRRGRHENISVVVTSHMMSNYKDTRIILNESNSITFYPRSGGTDAIKYTLKKYANMSSADINKALSLPSRWVTVYKNYPCYILYEKGVYLI